MIILQIYEDNVIGKLSNSRFLKLSADYEKEQQGIENLVAMLEKEIEAEAGQLEDVDRCLKLAEKYSDITELTAPILNELVEKIMVHNPERIKGYKHVTVEIYFTHVGKIRIPLRSEQNTVDTARPA